MRVIPFTFVLTTYSKDWYQAIQIVAAVLCQTFRCRELVIDYMSLSFLSSKDPSPCVFGGSEDSHSSG